MKKLQFKCTLLSDVVLSASPATQGGGDTLDFIPGNVFLGIAASSIYRKYKECDHTWLLFHSGHVRFGDANPSRDGLRGLRVPAAFYSPKYPRDDEPEETKDNRYYVIYRTDGDDKKIKKMQLKQCRNGYYIFNDVRKEAFEVRVEKDTAIKSAYDSKLLRSKDGQLFTYQSLRKDLELYFEVEFDDEAEGCSDEVAEALAGKRHVGRSRSAQYGLVDIVRIDDKDRFPDQETCEDDSGKEREIEVYADGRLIFLDEYGRPTFQPTAADLGFIDPENCRKEKKSYICWDKSQIRSFQYAPWNYQRQAFGNDRCGIEKGSVFVVKTSLPLPRNGYVGSYNNEGFGKVLYNPKFLRPLDDGEGRCAYRFPEETAPENGKPSDSKATSSGSGSHLIQYLRARMENEKREIRIMKEVNDFVEKNEERFTNGGESFASQWGNIRNYAMCTEDSNDLLKKVKTYLTHGIAEAKWMDRGRYDSLKKFMEQAPDKPQENLRELLINLSSEMAKICSNKR